MNNLNGQEFLVVSSDKYFAAAANNVEYSLENIGRRLPQNCVTPISCGYCPEVGVAGEIICVSPPPIPNTESLSQSAIPSLSSG